MNLEVISLERIEPNPRNPRRTIANEALQELADSIKSQGLLQPITVRIHPEDARAKLKKPSYQIVLGERRYRASVLAGLEDIQCIVREMTDREVAEAMLVENLQRSDVDPIEEARYVESALMQGMTAQEVGSRLGKSAKWVAIRMQIAGMPEAIISLLKDGVIGVAHVQALAQVKDPELRIQLASEASGDNWTVAQLRSAIEKHQRKLADAPWKMNLKFGGCPSCVGCPDRSDKQGDLFGGEKNALCLDGKCWVKKLDAHKQGIKEKLEAQGLEVHTDTYSVQAVENGWNGFTRNEAKIQELKDAGVKPQVIIKPDGSTIEAYSTFDAPKPEPEEEDPEQKAKEEAENKEHRIKHFEQNIRKAQISKKLENPDETLFFDFLADAINSADYGVDEILELADEDENDNTIPVRHSSKVDFKKLRAAICAWIVDNIDIDEKDVSNFKLNAKKIRAQAEKQYAEEKAKEEAEEGDE